MTISYRVAVAIKIQPIVANGDDIIIVFFRPEYCSRNPARILPQNAPHGGIEPVRKSNALLRAWCESYDFCRYYLPMMQYSLLATNLDRIHVSMEWLVPSSREPIQCKRMTLMCIVKVRSTEANRRRHFFFRQVVILFSLRN